jgi:hypothetical protein
MSVDLKRQASDLYRERDEVRNIRTSEPLSLKKIVYASLAIMVLALVAVKMFGGFSRRTDPIAAAMTPPQVIKEAPPPELLQEPAAPSATPAEPAPLQPTQAPSQTVVPPRPVEPTIAKSVPLSVPPAPPPAPVAAKARPEAASVPAAIPATTAQPPVKQTGPRLIREKQAAKTVPGKPAKGGAAESQTPTAPPQPVVSELEQARRQLARDIVLEKNPALLSLLVGPDNKGWQADPVNADEYNVVFNIVDKPTGTPVQYIWRVNLSTRTLTPLSYYARKLS